MPKFIFRHAGKAQALGERIWRHTLFWATPSYLELVIYIIWELISIPISTSKTKSVLADTDIPLNTGVIIFK